MASTLKFTFKIGCVKFEKLLFLVDRFTQTPLSVPANMVHYNERNENRIGTILEMSHVYITQ